MAQMSIVSLVVSTAVSIIAGLYAFNVIYDAMPYTGNEDAADNATRAAVKTAVNGSFGLLVVVLILIAVKAVQGAI